LSALHFQDLGYGIHCVETGLYRHGLAACYLLVEDGRAALMDTGTSHTVPRLLELLERLGLGPEAVDYVMPTHVHLDHAGGAGALMAACPNARLVTHPRGAPHLVDPARLAAGARAVYGEAGFRELFGELVPVPVERVEAAPDGHRIDLAGRVLEFVDTPGHANHHACIRDERSGGFFTGDTFGISYRELDTADGPFLFAPTTPVAFDPEAWQGSIDRLLARDPRVMYLTHYGPLADPAAHEGRLRESVRAFAAIALAAEEGPEEGREERLFAAVRGHLHAAAREHGSPLDEAARGP
jgi:glyoxylase-like metal-dependent hydrolase (beta-lactamase superfamily II)